MKDISEKLLAIFLVEQREHVSRIRALLEGPDPAAAVQELLRRAHTLKGAARTVGVAPVETLAHRLESLFAQVRDGALALDAAARSEVMGALDAIEDAVAAAAESHRSAEVAAGVEPIETARVRADDLDALVRSSTQLLAESLDQNRVSRQLGRLCRRARELEQACAGRSPELEQQARSLSAQARSVQRAQQRGAWTLSRLVEQLEHSTARVRMAPAEAVYDAFRKMVRDLAGDEGKEIEFEVHGLEVQADRLVLQALKDPVMHLLRNAVSHGIEPPRERRSAGKVPAGRIVLRVQARGDRFEVMVEDDGRGIDLKAVAQVAVQRGLISEQAASSRPPEELARLILEPGLSTARSVTPLSGRGIGLSVVHEQVRQLQGEVLLRHQPGAGTAVLLSVPLSVSRHHVILAGCCGRTFALPARAIERLCRVRIQEVRTVEGRETVSFQGQAVPLAKLADLLELEETPTRNKKAPAEPRTHVPAAILRSGEQRLAVVVDALLDERNAVVKDLRLKPAAQAGKTAGGVLLEDGKVALVLDPAELFGAFRRSAKSPALQPVAEARPKDRPRILVVDDSITTRSLEKSILEAHGYNVRVAVDGVDAMERLRAERADLVIADILMPRLDGFGLLEQIKKDRDLAQIPVIIVSSLERGEDQQRGMALGAEAYIVKRKFDQRELLDEVRQLQ